MHQPNPWLLFVGGIALLNVSGMVWGLQAPAWARYVGVAFCVALGLLSMGLGVARYLKKSRAARAPVRAAPRRSSRATSAGPARPGTGGVGNAP